MKAIELIRLLRSAVDRVADGEEVEVFLDDGDGYLEVDDVRWNLKSDSVIISTMSANVPDDNEILIE